MIHEQIIAAIEKLTQGILAENKLELPENVKIALEHPVSLEHGDYSSSIAMQLAKLLKRAPSQIASEFKQKLLAHPGIAASIEKIGSYRSFAQFLHRRHVSANAEKDGSSTTHD